MTGTVIVILVVWALAMSGYGMFWRHEAEQLWSNELDQAFGPSPDSLDAMTGVGEVPPTPVIVTPRGDGGMDDLLLEALMPAPRFPAQRRPGGAS